ncbi:MAG TPA: carbamoyl-phosphate synthase large subunit, partial [Nitrososphaeraceae archaeon]|nr:carbamoyl-phosphate synthase large subunit [Nitrososphaeraceae archaeon]
LSFGGQTALNCGTALFKDGILKKYGINVLGTPINGIERTEDRQLFKEAMQKSNIPILPSSAVYSVQDAIKIAKQIGYPVIVRVAYTLGGKGGGVAHNEYELYEIVHRGITLSMSKQVLIEKYVGHWKQIEYEVMRDNKGNSIIVCNMENVLAMKVHTGDNIVVAPSQTLNNHEYHMLRSAAMRATKEVGIIGECNIQFGMDPLCEDYCAIEINARLSRSSALASKATGYPLAYFAAKLGLGYTLDELINKVTKKTTALFEPSLDYIVVKMPRWDFNKFEKVNTRLGTTMKSVGEVMAIGRTFEEAIQKAVRMCDIGKIGIVSSNNNINNNNMTKQSSIKVEFQDDEEEEEEKDEEREKRQQMIEDIEYCLLHPNDNILFDVVRAIYSGLSIERINELSSIDPWFLTKIKNIIEMEKKLKASSAKIDADNIRTAKQLGFSDKQLASYLNLKEIQLRHLRKTFGIEPVIKQIDTLAAEWPAQTNYLYLTYGGNYNDITIKKKKSNPTTKNVIVLGSGPYRIGSSVEFDWGTVNMVMGLKNNGIDEVSIINCNPETVSTDFDVSDRLYFEEITFERVMDIYEKENPDGIITCVGGQTANNLTLSLAKYGAKIIGTSSFDVDRAEDREKFGKLLDDLKIKQPRWKRFTNLDEAKIFSESVGFPVLVRPSYVLSGAAMKVVWDPKQLEKFIENATVMSPDHPIVISKFYQEASEVEVDGVSSKDKVIIGSIIEHIDNAGIHSGDAMMCIPPWRLSRNIMDTITDYSSKIARALNVIGPFNIQFLVKDEEVLVIEANIRASRSMPFVSKYIGVNLIDLAARAMLNKSLPNINEDLWLKTSGFAIKVPQFSFMQLEGADIVLGVEMHSTGEVACFGTSFYDSLSKSYIAAGYSLPLSGSCLITIGGQKNKEKLLPIISNIASMDYKIMATEHTADFLEMNSFKNIQRVYKINEPNRKPNIIDLLYQHNIDFIINIPSTSTIEKYMDMLNDEYYIRRKAVEMGIPVMTTFETTSSFIKTLQWLKTNAPTIEPLKKYIKVEN